MLEGTSPVLRREGSRKAPDLSDYNNHLLNFLHSKQAKVWLEHPIHIKDSLGMIRGKNDKVDAQRIATYAYKNRDEVRLWTLKRDIVQKLDRLTALRNRLIKVRKMMQSPLTDCKDFVSKKDLSEAKKACQSTMQALDKDIKKVNQDIQNTIQSDPYLKEPLGRPRLRTYRICKGCWSSHCNRNSYHYK